MMNPPNAGDRKMLPRMATYGLQIVSPSGGWPAGFTVAGIDDPGPGLIDGEIITGNGGGPAAGIGIGGSGGGVRCGDSDGFGASVAGKLPFSGADALELAEPEVATTARNSEIGFQEDFASSQARSLGLKLPSATLARMADSEKRPANSPFR
jgi:hypothetical protein